MAAQPLETPPRISAAPEQARSMSQTAPAAKDAPRTQQGDRRTYDASRLEPGPEDFEKARRERQERERTHQSAPYVSSYGTRIEERHDQNNRLTEIRVTPGSTEIPYTMKNTGERPIDNRPGADPRSTLDTPKFIQFGW